MTTPNTAAQTATNSILDYFNKQAYLGQEFSFPTSVTLSTTAETPILLIQNPIVTTNTFPNQKALFYFDRKYASNNQEVLVKLYLNPTVTGVSTAQTAVCTRPAYGTTSISKCYPNGQFTVSSNGTLASQLGVPSNFYVTVDSQICFILDPGQSILLTGTAQAENTTLSMGSFWYEL